MRSLIVRLWGEELGRLVWNPDKRLSYFLFNPHLANRPDVAPLLNPVGRWDASLPVYGEAKRIYQSLPPFLADSLPDAWGNRLFDMWVKKNNIPHSKVTPLYKLMFIGKRGMGALEFEPAAKELEHPHNVIINSLYKLALDVLTEKDLLSLSPSEDLTINTLLAAGTSAGGRQMKAILAINPKTGEIKSGQVDGLEGFEYFIIKFEDELIPGSEIEMAFYEMAVACGIGMEMCRLIKIDGVNHFMTKRFDRKNGEKIHLQTLAAINPEASSYEELMETCRKLKLTEEEITDIFRRLAFNVLANNTDDHNKNFSFMLEKGERWRLAPAYDLTFIFNRHGTGAEKQRCLSLYGKIDGISKEDLLSFAKENNIRGAERIVSKVAEALLMFPQLAEKYEISNKWRVVIQNTIEDNLREFGFAGKKPEKNIVCSNGDSILNILLSINTKGFYQISAEINGIPKRHFIKPGTPEHEKLQKYELGKLEENDFISTVKTIFKLDP